MNRSILIVICDFLLVSLLAFSTVDINRVAETGAPIDAKVEIPSDPAETGRDLTAVMRQALDEERKSRDLLMGELARARESLQRQQTSLADREKQVQTFQQQLQTREQEAQRLQQQQKTLQEQISVSQQNAEKLSRELQGVSSEALVSRERAALLEAESRKQAEQNTALLKQLAVLQSSNQVVLAEKERLAGRLGVAEAERRHAAEQVARMEEQVKVEREEKTRLVQQAGQLAEGVKTLASRSGELAQEIRENRPLASNTIFNDYASNRVRLQITAVRTAAFGLDASKRKDGETVLVADGTNIYALFHVQDTPLTFWTPGTDWEGLIGTLARGTASTPISSLVFALRDPRVVLVPLAADQAKTLGAKVYRVSTEPYKFQDAVLVGSAGYYGECRFEIDLTTPGYVKLDSSFIKGIFGKFNPSRGDLVFSRTGELLGVMANSTYCLMLRDFHGAATLRFAKDTRDQRTGIILSQLHSSVLQMPGKLQ